MNIRTALRSDLSQIVPILQDTELFPADMLEEMMSPYFDDPEADERWLVCEYGNEGVIGFSYCKAEPLTEGTWNLLAIGFRRNQRSGQDSCKKFRFGRIPAGFSP